MLTSDAIHERLQRALGKTRGPRVYLGVATPDTLAHAVTSDEDPAVFMTRVGCLIKPMTSAILCAQLRAEGASADALATEYLPRSLVATRELLEGLRIHHLLNHTHGLDDSDLHCAPLRDSYIDLEVLSRQLHSVPRLTDPGHLYSYGSAGSWLAAGIAEQIAARPFEALLTNLLGTQARVLPGSVLCAASGGGFEVPAPQLLRFALHEMGHYDLKAQRVSRPGFTTVETGTCLGWNCYRGGWLGHSSTTPGAPVLLRVHPERQIAVVVATDGLSPTTVVARGLNDLLPELAQLQLPKLTGRKHCDDPARYCGSYRNAHTTLHIELQADETLRVSSSAIGSTSLAPAEDDVFVATPAHSGLPRFLAFIGAGAAASHVWDGENIRRRT